MYTTHIHARTKKNNDIGTTLNLACISHGDAKKPLESVDQSSISRCHGEQLHIGGFCVSGT